MRRNLRWYIGALLLGSTIINYIDRQALSVLAPILKTEHGGPTGLRVHRHRLPRRVRSDAGGLWAAGRPARQPNGTDTVSRLVFDRRNGHVARERLWAFAGLRFLLGMGEAGNWPAATKTVAEWFPRRERGWAVALFDSGSSVGAAIAPVLVLWLHQRFDSWRPAFLITGALGFLWLAAVADVVLPAGAASAASATRSARCSPRIARAESASTPARGRRQRPSRACCGCRQTWGCVAARGLTDPCGS